MADRDLYEIELEWELMTPMEGALWGTTLALHATDADAGIAAANAALTKLRQIADARPERPEPEYEAAQLNVYISKEDFFPWYKVAHKIRYGREQDYQPVTLEQVSKAYEHYQFSRADFS